MKNWMLNMIVAAILISSILYDFLTYQAYLNDQYYYTHIGKDGYLAKINKKSGEVYYFNDNLGIWKLLNK